MQTDSHTFLYPEPAMQSNLRACQTKNLNAVYFINHQSSTPKRPSTSLNNKAKNIKTRSIYHAQIKKRNAIYCPPTRPRQTGGHDLFDAPPTLTSLPSPSSTRRRFVPHPSTLPFPFPPFSAVPCPASSIMSKSASSLGYGDLGRSRTERMPCTISAAASMYPLSLAPGGSRPVVLAKRERSTKCEVSGSGFRGGEWGDWTRTVRRKDDMAGLWWEEVVDVPWSVGAEAVCVPFVEGMTDVWRLGTSLERRWHW
ncbi:hypothetical protein K461DRAFT_71479 [Myriangium duriaei CBS 260.36]|uniref:Uncharacterized protein n=1 Tax=Myriangium duriaei CBS 260.36 TaxID=1168546 RepID=A0A9P4IVQ0_9PEZI|nr:hypothetical protein K461DRAFT_71479 [Myriangium duriaei CBS 260.36]